MHMQDNALAAMPESLPAEKVAEVKEIAREIDFADPSLTVSYAAKTMNSIANFADSLLAEVRAKDAGPVGEMLSGLLVQVKSVDIDKMSSDEGSFLSRLPVIGNMFNSFEKNMAQFKKVTDQVEEITGQLDKTMVGLLRDIEILEQLFAANRQHHNDLVVYIEAGKERLKQAREVELPALRAEAEKSGDSMKAQEVRDFAARLDRFERRLHDLEVSRAITVQTVPQIRLIQGNNQTLAEKIQTSIMTTIPIWKNQIVLAISLHRQKKAVDMQKKVSDTTNELLLKNADMLKDTTLATAKEAERAIVDIETIRQVHEKLISTIEESLSIAAQGRQQRQEAEKELQSMEDNLRGKLLELAQKKDNQELA
ncbi:toxic anion resistance protein, partial [Desulfovibrio sp. OttesenSCG-928-C14]|nr:toxic anion resistance protein [Desulfovibrio sp. OttesenSCG-928-C14]